MQVGKEPVLLWASLRVGAYLLSSSEAHPGVQEQAEQSFQGVIARPVVLPIVMDTLPALPAG